jgi:3-isopropylmalate dehydrogenase
MEKTIALAKGDGIGSEVINESIKILKVIEANTDYTFKFIDTPMGGEVWKNTGSNLPEHSFRDMKKADAILFGAVGLPDLPPGIAESGLLKIRQELDLYINLRPIKLYKPLYDISPLKTEIIADGIDFTIIRENTEGLYTQIGSIVNNDTAVNSMVYTRKAVERIINYAFKFASQQHHSEIISVDKANALACNRFWREIFASIGKSHPNINAKNFYVDSFCQWLLRSPSTIQTVVTENMFGDIISDEAAYLTGSLGMGASGNINPKSVSLFEPIHGSAPDIAGRNIANPIGALLSLKLMFETSFKDSIVANAIEKAILDVLPQNRTVDIMPRIKSQESSVNQISCSEMGDLIAQSLRLIFKI